MANPVIYVVSDSLGETAESVTRAVASQFNSSQKFDIRRVPYVDDKEILKEIVEEASGTVSVIAYTLVIPGLKEELERLAHHYNIPTADIMGPLLDALIEATSMEPKMEAGLLHRLDEQYYRRVEAIEFAVKYDDGKDPRGLLHADVVLIGVSRTSKTPVSMILANKRIKPANVPIVPEVEPPSSLFRIPPRKIKGLTIQPQSLLQIRQERLKSLGLTTDAEYASLSRIQKELAYADRLMAQLGCSVIDVTNKAVEETASIVLEDYHKGERDAE